MRDGIKKIRNWTAERISSAVLYVIVGITAVVFALFYLVGYNTQSPEVPGFNAPLLTDALIVLMIVLLVVASVTGVAAVFIGMRKRDAGDNVVNGVPAGRISLITFGVTLLLLVVTFVSGSTDAMIINGHQFTDVLALKVTDMFVVTSIIMIFLAIGAAIFGYTRYIRKEK